MEQLRTQFPTDDFSLIALVLLLPLVGAFVCGVFGKRLGKQGVRTMALSAVGGSFILCLVAFAMLVGAPHDAHGAAGHAHAATRFTWNAWRWFTIDGGTSLVPIDVAFSIDPLSGVMMLVVTGVGFLIHLYSSSYMEKDPGYYRFFAYLNLFVFSMLVLILGDNLAVLFVGWEGVGLCSYLLIGFWFSEDKKASAGKKAFITNRIGDFGLLVAMAMLVYYAGSLQFSTLERSHASLAQMRTLWPIPGLELPAFLMPSEPFRASVPTLVALALFVGCMGKSAQMPLYVWLPDAMAGPTPVSALIHAATMVTAGIYLVARTSFIFALSPFAMAVVAGTGAVTAVFAASIAFAQTDLKKVLAYSTVSQLGYMFVGVGSGAFAAGFFHVLTHAFFKGCLFLCAGSVIHAMHHVIHDEEGSQDMRNMGGLRKHMPITHATFLVSCLAIAGCPFTSGFFSKDEVLFKAFANQIQTTQKGLWVAPAWYGQAIYAVGVVGAVCTAFYMFRAYFLTFWGDFRGWKIVKAAKSHGHDGHHEHHGDEPLEGEAPHESPWQMTLPLGVLAVFAALFWVVYAEPLHLTALERFWHPVFATASTHIVERAGAHAMMFPLLGVGAAIFLAGSGGAYYVYVLQGGKPAAAFVAAAPGLHRIVRDKWRVDEFYDATILGFIDAMGETAVAMDKWLIDGVIARLTSGIVQLLGALLRLLQTGRVQVYAASMVLGVAGIGWFVLTPHASAELDTARLRSSGDVTLTAAPGHGYSYRWAEGDAAPSGDFTTNASFTTKLDRCETRQVHLEVRNVFGGISKTTYTPCREMGNDCCTKGPAPAGGAKRAIGDATTEGGAP
ncbi:MAG: NADH-quinone oxidoreductase subunit L [Deltaproteobacteria bacterium]|nr:NADH-quinone oxidoreductase subunit L [Deltaproteobacteria bacterium]